MDSRFRIGWVIVTCGLFSCTTSGKSEGPLVQAGAPSAGVSGSPAGMGGAAGTVPPVATGGSSGASGQGGRAGDGSDGVGASAGVSGASAGASGSSPDASSGGTDGGDGDGDGGSGLPPCLGDPRQLIVMGDSYVHWISHTFPQDLASTYGSAAVGVWDVPYEEGGRNYAVGGYAMATGGWGLIPEQLPLAIADDPKIHSAVMTGGGNDFILVSEAWVGGDQCRNDPSPEPQQVCQDIVQAALDAGHQLMLDAADAGIRDVVYFFYPNIPEGTWVGGEHPNALLDWSYPRVQALCDDAEADTGGRMRCHFLDMRPVFAGHPEYFAAGTLGEGDIHENSEGSKAMAKVIVELMKDRCIAQPASSGCCEP